MTPPKGLLGIFTLKCAQKSSCIEFFSSALPRNFDDLSVYVSRMVAPHFYVTAHESIRPETQAQVQADCIHW